MCPKFVIAYLYAKLPNRHYACKYQNNYYPIFLSVTGTKLKFCEIELLKA